jgi:hypothetical protein
VNDSRAVDNEMTRSRHDSDSSAFGTCRASCAFSDGAGDGAGGAGDGNRTRMTSLEGFECGSAEQRERRSDHVSACPSVTVNPLGSLSDRAYSGHVAPGSDPLLVRSVQLVGLRRLPVVWITRLSLRVGRNPMSLWSAMVVSLLLVDPGPRP